MNKQLIESAVLLPSLAAKDRAEAFTAVLSAMVDAGCIARKSRGRLMEQLQEREAQGSTGLGNGVAVPHVKEAAIRDIVVGVAICEKGLPFDAIDGRPVTILFLVLGPKTEPERHLKVLRWVSSLARNADFRRFARNVTSAEELRELLHEMSSAK